MSGFWRDLRLAARLLAHQRAFAFVVVLTLAVGLAANATVLALVDGLVLRPFPLRDIDRLSTHYSGNPFGARHQHRWSAWVRVDRWFGWDGGTSWPRTEGGS